MWLYSASVTTPYSGFICVCAIAAPRMRLASAPRTITGSSRGVPWHDSQLLTPVTNTFL